MIDNLTEDQESWWRRAAKAIASNLYEVHESDWMEAANCQVERYDNGFIDMSFIDRPTPEEEDQWAFICAHCPVFQECLAWAERNEITGVYVAGEWRE